MTNNNESPDMSERTTDVILQNSLELCRDHMFAFAMMAFNPFSYIPDVRQFMPPKE